MENLVIEVIRLLGLPGAVVVVNIYMIRSILASNEKKNHVISSHIEMSNDLLGHIAQEVKRLNDEILRHTEQCRECLKMAIKSFILIFVSLAFVSSVDALVEVSCHWANAVGAPSGHIYEMQISYDGAKTWEPLLDSIPSNDSGTTSVIMPEILGRAYQVKVRAWDSTEKNFTGLWSDPSERFMLMYFAGPPEFVGVIR